MNVAKRKNELVLNMVTQKHRNIRLNVLLVGTAIMILAFVFFQNRSNPNISVRDAPTIAEAIEAINGVEAVLESRVVWYHDEYVEDNYDLFVKIVVCEDCITIDLADSIKQVANDAYVFSYRAQLQIIFNDGRQVVQFDLIEGGQWNITELS